MFFIPGILISILTFPGVIVHELSHQLFCYLRHVPVYNVKYFQFKNPSGYVVHEPTDNPLTTLIISIGPFIVNTLLGALLLFPASIEMNEFGALGWLLGNGINSPAILHTLIMLISYWLGLSILMHAFPSTGDAQVLVNNILKNKNVHFFFKILVAPIIGLIYIGAFGSMFWLDLGYALVVAAFLPKIIALFF